MNQVLYDARKKMGKTHRQIAEEVGLDRSSYTHIERGTRSPSLDVAARIASVFNMSIEEIFFPKQAA